MTFIGLFIYLFCPTEDTENGHEKAQSLIFMLKIIRVMQSNTNWEGSVRVRIFQHIISIMPSSKLHFIPNLTHYI